MNLDSRSATGHCEGMVTLPSSSCVDLSVSGHRSPPRSFASVRRSLSRLLVALLLPVIATACTTFPDEENRQIGAEPIVFGKPRTETGKERRDPDGRPIASPIGSEPPGRSAVELGDGSFIGSFQEQGAPTSGRGGSSAGDITLNLVKVPVEQAAKTVLGDVLGVSYAIDPRADALVTVQTPRPVNKAGLARLFESGLKAAGLTIVDTGGTYRIVPTGEAAASGPSFQPDGSDSLVGTSTQIIRLRYVAASEMKRILEPLAPQGGVLRADDARGTVTVSGSPTEIAAMREAAALFDVDTMRGMSFAIVPVRSVSPDLIADDMRKVFGADKEGPMSGMVQFIPNKQLKSILVISPQQKYLLRAERLVRRLDAQGRGAERQFYTYTARNRPAKELATILENMFSGNNAAGGRAGDRSTAPRFQQTAVDSSARQGFSGTGFAGPATGGTGAASGLGSGTVSVSGGDAGGLRSRIGGDPEATVPAGEQQQAAALGRTAEDEVPLKIVADEPNNAVLILATQSEYQRVVRVLENLDIMPNQVLIEATIAEVVLKDDLQFGLRWFFQNKHNSATFTDAINGSLNSVFPGFSYALRAANVQVTLNALADITKVNIVSSPSLMVMDNKTATLQIGDQVPITTQSAISTQGGNAPIVNSVTYRDTGVILQIRPKINDSGRVLLDIEQEVSSVTQTTTSNIDSPTIQQRRVKTTVVVNDGESVALGGLIQDSRSTKAKQVPVLGDIPLIGSAFRDKDSAIQKTELVIFITPRVVRNLNEAQAITEEYRQRLSSFGVRPKRDLGKTVRRILE